jgi:hypothetical protein
VSDYSPWEGWAVSGWPVTTLLRGQVIADRGRVLGAPGDGRLVPRRIDPQARHPSADGSGRLRIVPPAAGVRHTGSWPEKERLRPSFLLSRRRETPALRGRADEE